MVWTIEPGSQDSGRYSELIISENGRGNEDGRSGAKVTLDDLCCRSSRYM